MLKMANLGRLRVEISLCYRFGSFEIFKPVSADTGRGGPSVGRTDILIQMLDYTIQTFYKEVRSCDPIFLKELIQYLCLCFHLFKHMHVSLHVQTL